MNSVLAIAIISATLGQIESPEETFNRRQAAALRGPSKADLREKELELRERQGSLLEILPSFEKHISKAAHLSKEDELEVRKKIVSARRIQDTRSPILKLSDLQRNQVGVLNRN